MQKYLKKNLGLVMTMRHLCINPRKCIGCSACALICSATWQGEFNMDKAFVKVAIHDRSGLYEITFSSQCKQCLKCAAECPSGALSLVEGGEGA